MRLELKDGTSNKFWEAELTRTWFDVRWGRIGSDGQKKRQRFPTAYEARQAYEKLVAEKRKKGYREPGKGAPPPSLSGPRDEKLETALRARPDDQAEYLVFSDFLQGAGEPIGELIAVQVALAKKKTPVLAKREKVLIKSLALLDADLGALTFRWGLLDSVKLENSRDWMDEQFDVRPVLEKLFGSPACVALRELKVGVIRWDHQEKDLEALFALAGRHAWAKSLQRLHLGDLDNVDMAHHSIGTVGRPISAAFPGLRSLVLHSSEKSWAGGHRTFDFSGLALPELRHLVIETCSMNKRRLKELWAAKLPKLEGLTLWFGSDEHGVDCGVDELAPLLEGKAFPHLRHLGLANAEFEPEIAAALPSSKLAPQLESLDLSMGTLDDSHLERLVDGAKAFKKLKTLDVRENFFSKKGLAALEKAYASVDAKDQKAPWEDDPAYRYVSVGE